MAGAIIGWAYDSPSALPLPFVKDLVSEDLGKAHDRAPSTDADQVEFVVPMATPPPRSPRGWPSRASCSTLGRSCSSPPTANLADKLEAGTFILRKNMTPDELVTRCWFPANMAIDLALREGLRLEQIIAKLETLPGSRWTSRPSTSWSKNPPQALLADYPWLDLPKGASLEGFLAPATYHVLPDITAEELIRKMLDTFYEQVGPDRLNVAKSRGLTFYQVLTLASLVEREAILDSERPQIAGVYQNRLDPKPWPTGSSGRTRPSCTSMTRMQLARTRSPNGRSTSFWTPLEGTAQGGRVPAGAPGLQDLPDEGPVRPARSAPRPSPRSTRHSIRTRRTGTCTSWPSTTARTSTRSPRPRRAQANLQEVRLPVTVGRVDRAPRPDDFAAPPTPADRARWAASDRAARPERLGRLRVRLAGAGLDAYFGVRPSTLAT